MRTWTLSFLAFAALGLLGAWIGVDSALQFIVRLLFLFGALLAVIAGIRSITLQMADLAGACARCAPGREGRAQARRREVGNMYGRTRGR